jgi:hypothetical protein
MHGCNYEYICIRHRDTQTLYVSDILHVPFLKEPGYGKVQIGIYITALEDVLQRVVLDGVSGRSSAADRPASGEIAENNNFIGTQKAYIKKRPAGNSRGRSKKRPRIADYLEVITLLYAETSAKLLPLGIHTASNLAKFLVASSSLLLIRHIKSPNFSPCAYPRFG